jgi:HEAT repeat protein
MKLSTAMLRGIGAILLGPGALDPGARALELKPVPAAELRVVVSSSAEGSEAGFLVDGRPGRPWVSAAGGGPGQTISFKFQSFRYLVALQMLPGHGASGAKFKEHARPAQIKVVWDAGEQTFSLEDRRVLQDLRLSGLARTGTLTIEVLSVHGSVGDGVAVGEIVLLEPKDLLQLDPGLRERIEADLATLGEPAGEAAAARLVEIGSAVAPWLVDAVMRSSGPRSDRALEVLMQIGGESASQVAKDLLAAGDLARVQAVIRLVAEHSVQGLGTEMAALLSDSAGEHYALALTYLAKLADPRGLGPLGQALASTDAARQELAVLYLGRYRDAGLEVARGAFTSTERRVRIAAVRSLGAMETPTAQELLVSLARGPDRDARDAAAASLVQNLPATVKTLVGLLATENVEQARSIVRELGKADHEGARATLVDLTVAAERRGWYDHVLAALHAQGDRGVRALFERLANEPASAEQAMDFLMAHAVAAAAEAAKTLKALPARDDRDDVRLVLLATIRKAQAVKQAPTVIQVYKTLGISRRVKNAAMETLGYLPTDEVRDLLLAELQAPDQQGDPALILKGVARLKDTRAIRRIMADLESRPPRFWSTDAVWALGQLGAPQAIGLFVQHFEMMPLPLKLAALEAAKAIGTHEALELLVKAATSHLPQVRSLATKLLAS